MKPPPARAASGTVIRSAPPPALLALPLVLHSLSTPLGEPFADDFSFLRRALFPGPLSWLDGGGSPIFWRPLSRQLYFGAFGELMLSHPAWIAGLHLGFILAS